MIQGERVRLDIHNILCLIYKTNKNLQSKQIKEKISKHNKKDISFLNNVALTTMRLSIHTSKIINQYTKNKLRFHEKILLQSAVTQIVFLNFKAYAVINCSVEIAKKLKIYPGFINATLKRISIDKEKLKKIKIDYNELPKWFKSETQILKDSEKDSFLKNFIKEPDLHVVFKDKDKLNKFEDVLIKTSDFSGFIQEKKDFQNYKSFLNGHWWVQDFSSFFPLLNLPEEYKDGSFLDACSAPGGKSFQILSKKIKIVLNDISSNRIKILKSNLKRLQFDPPILNYDFTKLSNNKKYDFIIIDSPCSAIGTIRRNPEILFRNEGPEILGLQKIQEEMLQKASEILNNGGMILYMVCSFLKSETEDQINKFLKNKKNFEKYKFKPIIKNLSYSKLIKDSFIQTMPDEIQNHKIDGYFAAYLKKIR